MKTAIVGQRAKLWAGKYPTNRKPVEKQRRKVMGLKLWKHNHDRQTAEDHIIVFHPRVWLVPDPILFEL